MTRAFTTSRRDLLLKTPLLGLSLMVGTRVDASEGATSRFRWPGGVGGALSLTFDDGLDSQLDTVMPLLDARKQRGTFFVTGDALHARGAAWAAGAARGHELGNHSVDHPCDLRPFPVARYDRREIRPVEALLDGISGPDRNRTFAYPCDVTDLGPGSPNAQAKRFSALLAYDHIATARTSEGEPNNPHRFARRRYRLQALAAGYNAHGVEPLIAYARLAIERGHWAILVFHDVVATPSDDGDYPASDFAAFLDQLAGLDLWCAPMGEVAAYVERAPKTG